MRPISQLASTAANQLSTGVSGSMTNSSQKREPLPRSWVSALFAKFSVIWPAKWADIVGTLDRELLMSEWGEGLAGMTAEQIKAALEHCRADMEWPPSIAEFKKAGRQDSAPYYGQQGILPDEEKALQLLAGETWQETRERGKQKLADLKAALRGN